MYITVKYNVTTTEEGTKIFHSDSGRWIKYVTIDSPDGPEIISQSDSPKTATTYTFSATGIQTLFFHTYGSSVWNSSGNGAFYSCGQITEVIIPEGYTDIAGFSACRNLTAVTIGSTVNTFGNYCFANTKIKEIDVPSECLMLPTGFLSNCESLTSVTLPNGLVSIGIGAFSNTSLSSITIPETVYSIETKAFRECSNLVEIHAGRLGNTQGIDFETFRGVATGGTLYYPTGSASVYDAWLSNNAYYLGYYGWNGQEEAVPATDITLVLPSSITGSGQTTVVVTPSYAPTDLRYASSNDSIATVTQEGLVVAVRDGEVTISVKDMNTGLESQQTITVTTSSEPVNPDDMVYVYTGFTVADSEQKRFNIVAEKGAKYKCLGVTYKTISACDARYSLYYVNSYGGVDVLVFKGKSFKKTDNITRLNYSRSFRNNTLEFENVNYMNEIKPAWELHTGYMVDSQSRKMHELVESTCVYLYDAEEQTYTPVVMTDKKLEYKTYYNQGRKFYTYTINVEESQSKERR